MIHTTKTKPVSPLVLGKLANVARRQVDGTPMTSDEIAAHGIPINNEQLDVMVKKGPPVQIISELEFAEPPIPAIQEFDDSDELNDPDAVDETVFVEPMQAEEKVEKVEEKKERTPEEMEAERTEKLRSFCKMPSVAAEAELKKAYKELKVVPVPITGGKQYKFQAFIMTPLTDAEWQAAEEKAKAISENSNRSAEKIFMQSVVMRSVKWPNLVKRLPQQEKAGLYPTLFQIAQTLSQFIDPEVLLNYSFDL